MCIAPLVGSIAKAGREEMPPGKVRANQECNSNCNHQSDSSKRYMDIYAVYIYIYDNPIDMFK